MKRSMSALLASTACILGIVAGGSASAVGQDTSDDSVRMTWFGITNWYYEIGDIGIIVDGAVTHGMSNDVPEETREELVGRVHEAMAVPANGVDMIFVGHEHGDHSVDVVRWARETGAPIYTSEVACDAAVANGLPPEQCTPVYGGEVIPIGDKAEARIVRWTHSFGCDASSEGGVAGIETFGFLFTVDTADGKLVWFMSDTGAGHAELVTNRIVHGVDYGAPLNNLIAAVRDAGLETFPLWQGGPESRVVNQARWLVPIFDIEYFMPQHYGARGGYEILSGLHYPFLIEEMPKLDAVLAEYSVETLASVNYFDAYIYDSNGVRRVDNTDVKAAMGLPAEGPGPIEQGTNPRSGDMECDID